MALSNFEVNVLVGELQSLVGAYINNFQQIDRGIFKMKIGKSSLLIWPPETVHITQYVYRAMVPPSLIIHVKKLLKGSRVESIEQHEFDRVITIMLSNGFRVVIELFSNGNIIVVDAKGKTQWAMRYEEWKDRTIKPKHLYSYPKTTRLNPLTMSYNAFETIFTQKDVIRSLVKGINMSPAYLEEICARAGIEKNAKTCDKKQLFDAIKMFMKIEKNPGIQGKPVPIKMVTRKEEFIPKNSFNEALDDYYTLPVEKLDDNARILEKQKEALKEMQKKVVEMKEVGDKIYAHFNKLDKIMKEVKRMRKKGMEWREIEKALNIKINPKEKSVEVDI